MREDSVQAGLDWNVFGYDYCSSEKGMFAAPTQKKSEISDAFCREMALCCSQGINHEGHKEHEDIVRMNSWRLSFFVFLVPFVVRNPS